MFECIGLKMSLFWFRAGVSVADVTAATNTVEVQVSLFGKFDPVAGPSTLVKQLNLASCYRTAADWRTSYEKATAGKPKKSGSSAGSLDYWAPCRATCWAKCRSTWVSVEVAGYPELRHRFSGSYQTIFWAQSASWRGGQSSAIEKEKERTAVGFGWVDDLLCVYDIVL